jgi:serine/threonine-protein kinase
MGELREQLQTTLGSAYTLERELGAGGMSRVFVAEETRFGRRVVVKVLPRELAAEVSIERFEREIALAARLQHSHIVPVLTAGESAGLPYYTMPLVNGESLRARLARGGEVPVSLVVKVLRDVASALEYAHGEGVVHRDIKPENILLTAHDALVTDFGVAKAIRASATAGDASGLTSVGLALGTPAYMAPEQAAADPDVDHRADLYALGCVGYEMLAGTPPFSGRPPSQLLAAHVTEAPEALTSRRAGLPPALTDLVMRCLAKRAADRPQTGGEILEALDGLATPRDGVESPTTVSHGARAPGDASSSARRLMPLFAAGALILAVLIPLLNWRRHTSPAVPSPAGASAEASSIVVLPFDNVGGDTSDLYFADGITDELSAALGRVPGMRVAGRSSAYSFRGKNVSAQEIGRTLNVGSVLEGSVRRAGGKLRLTAQLVSASDGLTRWSDSYQRDAKDVFQVQDELAQAITAALRPMLDERTRQASAPGGAHGTADVVAYDLYLRGRYLFEERGEASLRRAASLFKEAIARDTMFARAHAGLALALVALPYHSHTSPDSVRPEVLASARRALAIDPNLADAHAAMGSSAQDAWRWSEAEQHFRAGMGFDSNDVTLLSWYSNLLAAVGKRAESLHLAERGVALDPLSPTALNNLASSLIVLDRAADALATMHRATDLEPSLPLLQRSLAEAYLHAGFPDSAAMVARQNAFEPGDRAEYEAAAGHRDLALALIDTALSGFHSGRATAYPLFNAYLALGEIDSSLAWLAVTVDHHEEALTLDFLSCDPSYAPLNTNEKYRALLRRIGLSPCSSQSH